MGGRWDMACRASGRGAAEKERRTIATTAAGRRGEGEIDRARGSDLKERATPSHLKRHVVYFNLADWQARSYHARLCQKFCSNRPHSSLPSPVVIDSVDARFCGTVQHIPAMHALQISFAEPEGL